MSLPAPAPLPDAPPEAEQVEALAPPRDDDALMAALQQGDAAAYREMVERHCDRVYAFLCRRMGDSEAAGPVLEQAMLRLHRQSHRYTSAEGFRPFLYRQALAALRGVDRDQPDSDEAELMASFPLASAPEEDGDQELVRALSELPEGLREAWLLAASEGLSLEELGSALGVGVDQGRARLHRARAVLAQRVLRVRRPSPEPGCEYVTAALAGESPWSDVVEPHIEECGRCAAWWGALRAVDQRSLRMPPLEPPYALRQRLFAEMDLEFGRPPGPPRPWWHRALPWALGTAIALCLMWAVPRVELPPDLRALIDRGFGQDPPEVSLRLELVDAFGAPASGSPQVGQALRFRARTDRESWIYLLRLGESEGRARALATVATEAQELELQSRGAPLTWPLTAGEGPSAYVLIGSSFALDVPRLEQRLGQAARDPESICAAAVDFRSGCAVQMVPAPR